LRFEKYSHPKQEVGRQQIGPLIHLLCLLPTKTHKLGGAMMSWQFQLRPRRPACRLITPPARRQLLVDESTDADMVEPKRVGLQRGDFELTPGRNCATWAGTGRCVDCLEGAEAGGRMGEWLDGELHSGARSARLAEETMADA
jgi:hypothetical protein